MSAMRTDALRRYLRDAEQDLSIAEALTVRVRREHKLRNVVEDLENALAEARWLKRVEEVSSDG